MFGQGCADVAAAGDDGQHAVGQFFVDDLDQGQDATAGCMSEGLTTTALPIRRAGAICQMVIIMGQFHGPIAPTTPMGR